MNQNSNFSDDELDLKEVFLAIWSKKLLITGITTLAAIISIFYALSLPNLYTSTALLSPSDDTDELSSTLSSYSSIAGMAGITIPGQGATQSSEAIRRIQSLDFFSNHFLPNIKLENLFAVNEWEPLSNTIKYKSNIYDQASGKWVRAASYPQSIIPSNQEAYKIYTKILSIYEDKKTSFVSVSLTHESPFIAKKWIDIIIKNINETMREADKKTAIGYINFLNESSRTTGLTEMKKAIAQLLESQMQVLMMSSAGESYVYKIIDSPVSPEEKSAPNRSLIVILGTVLGGLIGLLISLIMHFRKEGLIR
tara:strand:+ start:289 stop:1215 length:927 start_codon:yes stop_codon:yes gene_type:complete